MTNISPKIITSPDTVDAVANTVSGLFSTLADAMPQMIFVTDPDGSHYYYNRGWYEYTGMSEAESMGFGFANALHPDDRERTLARWRSAWEAGENYEIEYRFKRHDGVYRWFVGRATPVRDAATGAVRMWVGTCTDIDDTRRALGELSESRETLSLALKTARLGSWEFDVATGTLTTSPFIRELFGFAPDEVPGAEPFFERIHEDDRAAVRESFTKVTNGEMPGYYVEYRVRRPDRTIRYLQARATRLLRPNGTAWLIDITQDVTEERNTLDALRESADALRESEARFRTVIGNAPLIVFAVNKNGIFTFSDGAALAPLGLAPGQVVGTSVFEVYADRPDIAGYIRRALGGEIVSWTAVVGGIYFETQCSPVTNDAGEPDGIIAVAFDVTEKETATATLAAREEQYRFLFNTVASGVVYQDGNARILDANPAAEEILGLTLRQMTGVDSFDSRWKAIKEDGSDFPGDEHPVPVALRTGQAVRGVPMGIFHPREERYRWLKVSAVPLFHPNETKPYLVYAYFEDETDRREAERRLRESEHRFRSMVRSAPLVVFQLDKDGIFLFHDGAGLTAAGREPGFSVGQSVFEIYADFPQMTEPTRRALAGELTAWRNTIHGVTYDTQVTPMRGEDGAINGIVGVAIDVSEQDKAESAIRESEERFRSLVTATAQIVWTTDATGAFASAQSAWEAFTGQTFAEYRQSGWISAVHVDDLSETGRLWNKAIANCSVFSTEHRLRRADGVYRYMSVRAVPVLEDGGAVREWIGVHSDISERKEAELALSEYATRQARVAETLQRSLLNTPPGNTFPGVRLATHYEPALDEAQVGGDFFDVFALQNGNIALVIGDVTGKGLRAAEHTGQIKYALRAFLRENPDPADALTRVNRLLTDAQVLDANFQIEDTNAMAAATVAVLETATGVLRCAGGGAEYPLCYRAATGKCDELQAHGVVIGASENSIYTFAETVLAPGDLLTLCTDGITEARRSRREFFGNEGVCAAIETVCRETSEPEAVCAGIVAAAKNYSATGTFSDDVCVLIVRREYSGNG